MNDRAKASAVRSAIVAISIYLIGLAIGRIPVASPISRKTLILAAIFVIAWAMVTAWQVSSRVERWSWSAIGAGYLLCGIATSIVFVAAVRLLLFLKFGH